MYAHPPIPSPGLCIPRGNPDSVIHLHHNTLEARHAWWLTPMFPAPGRPRLEGVKFNHSLGYRLISGHPEIWCEILSHMTNSTVCLTLIRVSEHTRPGCEVCFNWTGNTQTARSWGNVFSTKLVGTQSEKGRKEERKQASLRSQRDLYCFAERWNMETFPILEKL